MRHMMQSGRVIHVRGIRAVRYELLTAKSKLMPSFRFEVSGALPLSSGCHCVLVMMKSEKEAVHLIELADVLRCRRG